MSDLTRDALAAALHRKRGYTSLDLEVRAALHEEPDTDFARAGLDADAILATYAGQALGEVVAAAEALVAPEARDYRFSRTERLARALDKLREAAR